MWSTRHGTVKTALVDACEERQIDVEVIDVEVIVPAGSLGVGVARLGWQAAAPAPRSPSGPVPPARGRPWPPARADGDAPMAPPSTPPPYPRQVRHARLRHRCRQVLPPGPQWDWRHRPGRCRWGRFVQRRPGGPEWRPARHRAARSRTCAVRQLRTRRPRARYPRRLQSYRRAVWDPPAPRRRRQARTSSWRAGRRRCRLTAASASPRWPPRPGVHAVTAHTKKQRQPYAGEQSGYGSGRGMARRLRPVVQPNRIASPGGARRAGMDTNSADASTCRRRHIEFRMFLPTSAALAARRSMRVGGFVDAGLNAAGGFLGVTSVLITSSSSGSRTSEKPGSAIGREMGSCKKGLLCSIFRKTSLSLRSW